MPHPGAHISVVQLLAASKDPADAAIAALFGNAETNVTADGANAAAVLRNRYACLGAIGPDLLYFLLDASDTKMKTQDLIIRLYSTIQAVEDIAAELTRLADTAKGVVKAVPCADVLIVGVENIVAVFDTAKAAAKTLGTLAAGVWVDQSGMNLFSLFDSPRQAGEGTDRWYWADHLHYQKTGRFTANLLDLALFDPKYKGDAALGAYAAGYFTHYVADTIGHPYVNAIVGGPYRMHRQRHTLVENFIDNVVWRNGFVSGQVGDKPFNPATGRPWVDRVRTDATPKGAAASSFYRSRVDQMIDVGGAATSLSDDIGDFLSGVAAKLDSANAMFTVGSVNFTSDALFDKWCDLLVHALHQTYDAAEHPKRVNLDNNGFLKRDDIKVAYVTCYALLKMSTTESIPEPVKPDFSQVTKELEEAWNALKNKGGDAMEKIFSLPKIPSGSSFSLSAAWDALTDWVRKVVEGVAELIGAVVDMLAHLCTAGAQIGKQVAQLAVYTVQVALRAVYIAARRMLELRAYSQPMDDTVTALPQLWQAGFEPVTGGVLTTGRHAYPVMEREEEPGYQPFSDKKPRYSQDQLFSKIEPVLHPLADSPTGIEQPAIAAVTVHAPKTNNPLFELFWAPPATNMFAPTPALVAAQGPATGGRKSFQQPAGFDFGGIVPNCQVGLRQILKNAGQAGAKTVETDKFKLPDYNLDGDRGGGFPSWRLVGGSHRVATPGAATAVDVQAWS